MALLPAIQNVSLAVRSLSDPANDAWLTVAERQMVAQAGSERRQRELRAGRAAAHEAMQAAGGTPTPDVLAHPDGRPRMQPPSSWHVSIAHDGELAVAACASKPVGIDLVPFSRLSQVERVVRHGIETGRAARLEGDHGHWAPELLLWTGWEAAGKQAGAGLSVEIAQTVIRTKARGDQLVAELPLCELIWWGDERSLFCLAVSR